MNSLSTDACFRRVTCALAAILVTLVAAEVSATSIENTGNLLANHGFESGTLAPWGSTGETFNVTNSPASLSTGSIDATEGDYYVYLETTRSTSSSVTFTTLAGSLTQNIVLSDYGIVNPLSITLGGDLFGVGRVVSGVGYATGRNQLRAHFFGSSGFIGQASMHHANSNISDGPVYAYNVLHTLAIPEGTTEIQVQFSFSSSGGSTGAATMEYLLGADNLYASIEHVVVPEPSSLALAGLGTLGLGAMALRRRRLARG